MERTTFTDPNVSRLLSDHYIPVKLNYDHPMSKQIAAQHGFQGIPADVIVAPTGQILAKSPGALNAQQYTTMLARAIEIYQTPHVAQTPQNGNTPLGARPTGPAANTQPQPQPQPNGYAPGSTSPYNQTPNAFNNGPGTQQQLPLSVHVPPQGQTQTANQYGQPNPALQNLAAQQNMPQQPYGGTMAQSNPPIASQQPLAGQAPTQQVQPQQNTTPQVQTPAPAKQQQPNFGLEGYCPVELVQNEKWVPGDLRYGAVHQGVTYLFAGPEQQKLFLASPERYAPANRGFDIVLSTETGQFIPGKRQHGVFLVNAEKGLRTIYLFASEATLKRFQAQMGMTSQQASIANTTANPQQQQSYPQAATPAEAAPEQAKKKKPWWFL
jgi:protein disulfide-isomerase